MDEKQILLYTFYLLIIQLVILAATIFALYFFTKNQIEKMEGNTKEQISALNKGTDKQINKIEESAKDQIQALQQSGLLTIEKLLAISIELHNTNSSMGEFVNDISGLKESFVSSSDNMEKMAYILEKDYLTKPKLVVEEDAFQGKITTSLNKPMNLQFNIANQGPIPSDHAVISFFVDIGIDIESITRGKKKAIKTVREGARTIFKYQFLNESISSDLRATLNINNLIGNKVGTYEIRWTTQCINTTIETGVFKVTVLP